MTDTKDTKPNNSWITLGRFNAAHGIKGDIKLESFTEDPAGIFSYPLHYQTPRDERISFSIERKREISPNLWVVHIQGCESRNDAEDLSHSLIQTTSDALPPLAGDEFYWSELIGLDVYNQENVHLGHVKKLVETGANDVLVVAGEKEHWIPYSDDAIIEVKIEEKVINVCWDKDF